MAATRLRYLLMLSRDVPRAARFYQDALGLSVSACTETWAEVEVHGGTKLAIKAAEGEAFATTGFSPFVVLDVEGLDELVPRALQVSKLARKGRV